MSEVNLIGLASNIEGEERALAYLEVKHNNNVYEWQIFVPSGIENLQNFIESIKQSVLDDIDAKELIWNNLNPKTRLLENINGGEPIEVEINKEEIVRPTVPDYYALRRKEYPSLGDQLDALWKGTNSQAYIDMINKINTIKTKYPKP